mmetsp:Transcript_33968/g.48258  ORF Transcript_33968/g.48258 Transcript_33968/m.48258 type:complete len:320 (+) Transcript_33968:365-1324(+)
MTGAPPRIICRSLSAAEGGPVGIGWGWNGGREDWNICCGIGRGGRGAAVFDGAAGFTPSTAFRPAEGFEVVFIDWLTPSIAFRPAEGFEVAFFDWLTPSIAFKPDVASGIDLGAITAGTGACLAFIEGCVGTPRMAFRSVDASIVLGGEDATGGTPNMALRFRLLFETVGTGAAAGTGGVVTAGIGATAGTGGDKITGTAATAGAGRTGTRTCFFFPLVISFHLVNPLLPLFLLFGPLKPRPFSAGPRASRQVPCFPRPFDSLRPTERRREVGLAGDLLTILDTDGFAPSFSVFFCTPMEGKVSRGFGKSAAGGGTGSG